MNPEVLEVFTFNSEDVIDYTHVDGSEDFSERFYFLAKDVGRADMVECNLIE